MGNRLEEDLSAEQQDQDGIITIVLTADNHLGSTSFAQPPRKREERQQRLRHAFQQASDFAVGQGVDLFVQAGDLFDTTNPSERDRSFVAARLAQLRQAGIRTFALGGVHDTPTEMHSLPTIDTAGAGQESEGMAPLLKDRALEDTPMPAPQMSYARLGALHYFTTDPGELEPVLIKIRNMSVAICGLGVMAGQEGDPLEHIVGGHAGPGSQGALHIEEVIERAAISLLILHAPIEGIATGSSLLDTRAQVSRASIENQSLFSSILAGYHHSYRQLRIGRCDVVVAGATQHIDFSNPGEEPGFVFLGLGASGIRWCKHIAVDALLLRRLVIHTSELWPGDSDASLADGEEAKRTQLSEGHPSAQAPVSPLMDTILERLRPLCSEDAMVQLRLEGQLTRNQYHQLDLNRIRRYGEEKCFALAIDDSNLDILPFVFLDSPVAAGEEVTWGQVNPPEADSSLRNVERFSPREELIALADEWIAATNDEEEKKALRATREELLTAMDEVVGSRFIGTGAYYNYGVYQHAGNELPC